MEQHKDAEVRTGLVGLVTEFLGELLWECGQIGQAMLDGVTVVLVALLIYHQGAVLNTARQMEHSVVVPSAAPQPSACNPDLDPEGACIVAQVLKPSAT